MIRVAFFGTPEFSVPFLSALCDDPSIEVVAVVSQPDRPMGRGHEIAVTPTKSFAVTRGIPVLQPETLRDSSVMESLRALGADVFVVVAYGKIIPQAVLDIPRLGCVNVHPSLLPKYRGPSPMNWAIAEGDARTGVTIMLLDAGMDTGPILSQVGIELDAEETMETLMAKTQAEGIPLLLSTVKRLLAGEIIPVAQDNAQATVTRLLDRADGHIDWNLPMNVIERRNRAYRPWPGLWTFWNRNGSDVRLKVHAIVPADFRADLSPGTVLVRNNRLFVDCADGTIELLELQPEGKARMSAEAFLMGYSDVNGAMLG